MEKFSEFYYENHHRDSLTAWYTFYRRQELVDIKLCCSGGHIIKAHRLVLATASEVLKKKFKEDVGQTMNVNLQNFSKNVMLMILDFMYKGYVSVPEAAKVDFLNAGKYLQVKGISDEGTLISNSIINSDLENKFECSVPNINVDTINEICSTQEPCLGKSLVVRINPFAIRATNSLGICNVSEETDALCDINNFEKSDSSKNSERHRLSNSDNSDVALENDVSFVIASDSPLVNESDAELCQNSQPISISEDNDLFGNASENKCSSKKRAKLQTTHEETNHEIIPLQDTKICSAQVEIGAVVETSLSSPKTSNTHLLEQDRTECINKKIKETAYKDNLDLCVICYKYFHEIDDHIKTNHKKTFRLSKRCSVCHKLFYKEEFLNFHVCKKK